MSLSLKELKVEGYERVVEAIDRQSGLHAFIAIHNTELGPGLGGIRIYPYKKPEDALNDVLRLSKGMTLKSALAECGLGGGKAVVIADPKRQKTEELFFSLGKAVDQFEGSYICAEDVGCTPEDIAHVRKATQYCVGLDQEKSSGDPSRYTAWGTYRGIQATLESLYGSPSVSGRTIAVQGLGAVGSKLLEYLFWEGAVLKISDVDHNKAAFYSKKYGAKILPSDDILYTPCDIFSPCALGGIFSRETIPHLQCKGIAGCANNQLLEEADAIRLRQANILYAPDFVTSAGGLINVQFELEDEGYRPTLARAKVDRIYPRLLDIFTIAKQNQCSTYEAAISLANYRLKYGIGKRPEKPCFHHQ
ncbi:MAG: leucine dehydrogenase [Simkaniaceae bacterium]|nr:leucine dehydrogenase [Simkaniaceae bacterium]